MKTLGRILIILAAFALVMGSTYIIVNAGTSGNPSNSPAFERGDGLQSGNQNGERPPFPDRPNREFRGERGGGWIFGAIKNLGIVGFFVALIVLPKEWIRKRQRAAHVAGE